MDINTGMIAAGLAVGLLVGLTGMGAGSLMTPDPDHRLRHPADHRRRHRPDLRGHHQDVRRRPPPPAEERQQGAGAVDGRRLRPGRVPGRVHPVESFHARQRQRLAAEADRLHPGASSASPSPCARSSASAGLWDHGQAPHRRPLDRHHKVIARLHRRRVRLHPRPDLGRLGRVLRHGPGHAVPTLRPARGRHRPVPRDAGHRRRRTGHDPLGHPGLQRGRLDPDRLDPRHPDRLAFHAARQPSPAARRHRRWCWPRPA